jgi:hypothetical protein
MYKDPSAILPEGNEFLFWEKECVVKRILHVNAGSPAADDANDGSEERPFKTIGQAALIAQPGDKVLMSKYAGTEVKVDGVEYTILRQSDILAIVE